MAEQVNISLSQLSLNSTGTVSEIEDWDRSLSVEPHQPDTRTPRSSVAFPVNGEADVQNTPQPGQDARGKRTLSELLKLHAEKGTDVTFTQEEANRIADVLGQWINSGPSPYESEDDFFTRSHSQDDSSLTSRRSPLSNSLDSNGRPRGQSESVVSQSSDYLLSARERRGS